MKNIKPINLMDKFSLFNETWTPKIIGELNGQYVKLCKLENDFIWHSHEKEDELFMVFKGTLFIELRGREKVEIREGEVLIIPKGVEHRPYTNGDIVFSMLFEPKNTLHIGDTESNMTIKSLDWI